MLLDPAADGSIPSFLKILWENFDAADVNQLCRWLEDSGTRGLLVFIKHKLLVRQKEPLLAFKLKEYS